MKILKSVQENFATLGIHFIQSTLDHVSNFKKLTVIFILSMAIISSYVGIYRAYTFEEYTDAIHVSLAFSLCSVFFAIVLWKMTKISTLIGSIEGVIIDSKQISSDSNHPNA